MKASPCSVCALTPLLIAACASTPVHYHTLVPALAGSLPARNVTYRIDDRIKVEHVSVPTEVDRLELVVRQRDGQVALWENDLWLAPLADEVKGALLAEMQRQLASTRQSDSDRTPPQVSLRVDIARFESAPSRYAAIEATWQLQIQGREESILSCRTSAYEDVSSGVTALVKGYQRALVVIADQIIESVRRLATGGSPACPV